MAYRISMPARTAPTRRAARDHRPGGGEFEHRLAGEAGQGREEVPAGGELRFGDDPVPGAGLLGELVEQHRLPDPPQPDDEGALRGPAEFETAQAALKVPQLVLPAAGR